MFGRRRNRIETQNKVRRKESIIHAVRTTRISNERKKQ